MKFLVASLLCLFTLSGYSQLNKTHSLRVGGQVVARDGNLGYSLREEFRFSTDTSRMSNIVFIAPGFRYYFNEHSRIQAEYWFFLNESLNRVNLDYWNDFGPLVTRVRFQSGWDEFQDRGDAVRFLFRFQPDMDIQGFFNPAIDFEIFHEFGTNRMLDRYRGGIGNRFKISENIIVNFGVRSQTFTKDRQSRDYLYRLRLTYKI